MRSTFPEALVSSHRSGTGVIELSDTGAVEYIELRGGSVHSRHLVSNTTVQIRALSGSFWVTLEGDSEDYVLETGEIMFFSGPGLLVAEGLLGINAMEQQDSAAIQLGPGD